MRWSSYASHGSVPRYLPGTVGGMAELCRCHLPSDSPSGRHWFPSRHAEPDLRVLAIALHGQDPQFLRRVRVPGGWHSQGLGAAHPDATPPKPWTDVGLCWAGQQHAVVDVTWCVAPADEHQLWVVVAAQPSSGEQPPYATNGTRRGRDA